jgi:hypothetical protein
MLQKRTLLVAALAASLTSSASATLIAYEGFNYAQANGTSITSLNGGTGWDEAYPAVEGTIRLADGLSFTGHLASEGKSADRNTGNATMSANGRNWESALASGTYWYSFIMQPTATASANSRGTFGILQGSATNQNGFGIRFDFTGTAGPGATLTINANTPVQSPGTNITFASGWGVNYLVIGRLTVNTAANTTNDVWAFQNGATLPTSVGGLGAVMSTSTASSTGVNPAMYGRAFGNSTPTLFDEIRIGTTFADVASAIPEPSSAAALAGLGALGLIATSRRRRA